jgi:hypothetical protein
MKGAAGRVPLHLAGREERGAQEAVLERASERDEQFKKEFPKRLSRADAPPDPLRTPPIPTTIPIPTQKATEKTTMNAPARSSP